MIIIPVPLSKSNNKNVKSKNMLSRVSGTITATNLEVAVDVTGEELESWTTSKVACPECVWPICIWEKVVLLCWPLTVVIIQFLHIAGGSRVEQVDIAAFGLLSHKKMNK